MARRHPKNRRNASRSKAKGKSLSLEDPRGFRAGRPEARAASGNSAGRSSQPERGTGQGRRGRTRDEQQERRMQNQRSGRGRYGGQGFQPVLSPEAVRDSLEKILTSRLDAKAWAALAERFRQRLKDSDWGEPAAGMNGAGGVQSALPPPVLKAAAAGVASGLRSDIRPAKPVPAAPAAALSSLVPSRSYRVEKKASPARELPKAESTARERTSARSTAQSTDTSGSSSSPRPDRGFALARNRLSDLFGTPSSSSAASTPAQASQPKGAQAGTGTQPNQRLSVSGMLLDPWQAEALDALLAGHNVVVDAPTSAGKTRVIEALLDAKLQEGLRLIYTSPVKSLSNDKYREFCEKYGKDRVGINTGDFKENLRAPIILATLETYRNSLLGVEPDMRRRVVVYDEYHYLQDESRGSAWEESLILTPKESQVILLSASVPNADEFAQWLETLLGRPSKLVRVSKRPVPLADVVYTSYGWIYGPDLALRQEEIALIRRMVRGDRSKGRRRDKSRFDELLDPVRVGLEQELGPIVVYAGRRADVEAIAHVFARGLPAWTDEAAMKVLHERLANLPGWDYVPHELQRMIRKHGIAFHHSGLIPPGRVAIESLLKEGLLRICSGTMGISLGVNFAVRSALISDTSRPSEGGETKYGASEVMQMLGRAGRRGKDSHGFSMWMNLGRFVEQKPAGREPCRSSLKFDPTTVLGILGQKESLAYLSYFYRKSFFMRGRDPQQVMIVDHELISAMLYKDFKMEILACEDIPETFKKYHKGHQRSQVPCNRCPARIPCHNVMSQSGQGTLQKIISHLRTVGAIEGQVPTLMGQLARHFPQAGGMIVARKLAEGEINSGNMRQYLQLLASFCSAHFKEIPDTYADLSFLSDLNIPRDIEFHYPEELFPELYDEVGFRREEGNGPKVFREFNMGAASIVSAWIDNLMSWEELVEEHSTKHFSAGDCMMVLFRFATFLQSLARLEDYDPDLAKQARVLIPVVLRDPLDARNRMLSEETDEFESEDNLPDAAAVEDSGESGALAGDLT
ncbi:MAG: DEAD/DEAH box helicase [Betaproteobacteria bacterium]|nr:DEAD/DEAH box helicase [Betaproteobacteria bacterium]